MPGFHDGSGEPLLLLHGLGSCWQVWEPVLGDLATTFEVDAPDLPGFGANPPLAGVAPTPGALADAVEGHLDALGWEQAHLAGNSMGGLLVLELARRGRARSVTAISPAGMAEGWEDAWARALLRTQVVAGRRLRPLADRLIGSSIGRAALMGTTVARPQRLGADAVRTQMEAFLDSPSVLDTLELMDPEPTVTALDAIDAPTTIAWGSRDRLLLPQQGPRYKAAMPQARLVKLDGLGHCPMSDDPALVADVIRRTAQLATA